MFVLGVAGAGYWEDYGLRAVEYVTDPSTPTIGSQTGLLDPLTGLVWVEDWGSFPADTPRVQNDSVAGTYNGSFFYNTAVVVLGEGATGISTALGHLAVNYVFHGREDAADSLDFPGAGSGIEPWWSRTVPFYNGYFDFPTRLLVPDAAFWNRNPAISDWPSDTDEVTLEWMLWDAIYLVYSGDPFYQDEVDSIIAGIMASPWWDPTDSILLSGAPDPYLTSLWLILLAKYNEVYGTTSLLRTTAEGDYTPDLDYSFYRRLAEKAAEYLHTDGMNYLVTNYGSDGWRALGAKDAAEGLENYEALAFLMAFSLVHDTTNAYFTFATYVLDAGADNDDEPWGFVANIGTYAASLGPVYFPLTDNCFDGMFTILALKEYHDFVLPFDFDEADTCADWIREIAESLVVKYWADSAGRFIHDPHTLTIVPTNGIAGYSMLQVPRLEIVDVVSDLPNVGPGAPGPDYYANRGQNHTVSVTVVAHHTIASNEDTLWLYRTDCFGGPAPFTWQALPDMSPGDTVVLSFAVTEPMCVTTPANDHIQAVLNGPHTSGYSVVDDDITIEVDAPAQLNVDDVYAVADTLGVGYMEPYFTMGQLFWLAVDVTNNGDATVRDVSFDLTSSSIYGCASSFDPTYTFADVNIPAGGSATFYLPITADPDDHGVVGTDDEVFTVAASGVDMNTSGPCSVTYTDDDDSIGIVMPPSLRVIGWESWALGYTADGVPWVSADMFSEYIVWVVSDSGDYAVADSLWEYASGLDFFSGMFDNMVVVLFDIMNPSFVTVDTAAPGDTVGFDFWIWATSPIDEDTADMAFYAHFHDANVWTAPEPPTSPVVDTLLHAIAVDVTDPVVSPVAPAGSGDPWPADDTIRVTATDNFSGVAEVRGYIVRADYSQYWIPDGWGGWMWDPSYDEFAFEYDTLDNWKLEIYEPTGGYNYYIVLWAVDSAGNTSDTVRIARGSVAYLNIYDVITGLVKEVDPGEKWEADWQHFYTCSVQVYNPNSFDLTRVTIGLRSSSPWVQIWTTTNPSWEYEVNYLTVANIPAGAHVWLEFEVCEASYNFTDTLVAFLYQADPGPSGEAVGQQVVDDDAFVVVERPAMVLVESTWVDPSDAPVSVEDTNLVTQRQPFTLWVRVCRGGRDEIDSVGIAVRNGDILKCQNLSDTSVVLYHSDFTTMSVTSTDFSGSDTLWCVDLPFEYVADTTDFGNCNARLMEDAFLSGIWFVDFDNWIYDRTNVSIAQLYYDDTLAYVSVLEPPRLDIVTAGLSGYQDTYTGRFWINSWDTLLVWVEVGNLVSSCPDDGRATADSLDVYPMPLALFDASWTDIGNGIAGLDAPYLRPDTLYPGQDSMLVYKLYWDGATPVYEGYVGYVVDTVYFHDMNWASQSYPAPWLFVDTTSSGDTVWISAEMDTISKFFLFGVGIDVTKPVVDVYAPSPVMYSSWTWPDSTKMLATDNFSGVVVNSVVCQITDPAGNYWNGTSWQVSPVWLTTVHLGGDTFAYELPDVADLIYDGYYTVIARCSDVAGNESDVDTLRFLYDSTNPIAVIDIPEDSMFFNCTDWGGTIRVHAWDTVGGVYDVSGVRKVYIAIEDTVRHLWWNAATSSWDVSATWIWNEMTYAGGEIWEFSGYTPPAPSYVFRLWTFADDNVLNYDGPTDTSLFVLDCQAPHSYITDYWWTDTPPAYSYFNDTLWTSYMGDEITGYVIDTITAVDDVRLAIYSELDGMWWDDEVGAFTSDVPVWFQPDWLWSSWWSAADMPALPDTFSLGEFFPGYNLHIVDTLWWHYFWTPPASGCYTVYVRAVDDLQNYEAGSGWDTTGATEYNTWSFAYDNTGPEVLYAYRPADGEVITHLDEWWDTLWVAVLDTYPSCGAVGTNDIDSVKISIQHLMGGIPYWWNGTSWSTSWSWVDMTPTGGMLWYYYLPRIVLESGTYNVQVRAWDVFGNLKEYYYNFTIFGMTGYLTIEPLWDPVFVGEPFPVVVTALNSPGDTNTSFAYGLEFGSTFGDPDCIDLPSYPYYLTYGCDTIWVTASCPQLGLVLWVDAPGSGYDEGTSAPFDVVSPLDESIYAEVYDNPDDQGDTLWLVHTRSRNDLLYEGADIDTLTTYVVEYTYWVDTDLGPDTNWVQIFPIFQYESGDTLFFKVTNFGDFNAYRRSIIIHGRTKGVTPVDLYSSRILIEPVAPVDNVPPAAVSDLRIQQSGGNAHLWWDEVTTGVDGSPEIAPAENIVYYVFRSVGNPYDISTYTFLGMTDVPAYDDPLPASPVAQPTYYFVLAYDHNYNQSDTSEIVGRTSYEFGVGWSQIAVPFDVEYGSEPLLASELDSYLGSAGIVAMYRYQSGHWTPAYIEGSFNSVISEGSEALTVYGFTATTLSLCGDLMPAPVFSFEHGWNQFFLPLDRLDIGDAIDLMNSIDASVGCLSVAHRIPGGGWQQLVEIGGVYYGNFDVYVGQAYMAWATSAGNWPPSKGYGFGSIVPAGQPADALPLPKALVGDIEGAWEPVHFKLTTKDGQVLVTDDDPGCAVYDGKFIVQVGNIDWSVGDEYVLVLYADGGDAVEIPVVVDGSPAQYLGKYHLADVALPAAFALYGARPNPFNAATQIRFDVPSDCRVTVEVYDVDGRRVATLVDGAVEAGTHSVVWRGTDDDGNDLPGGVYFCRMKAEGFSAVEKILFVK